MTGDRLKVLIVDDHALVLHGFALSVLELFPEAEVFEANSLDAALSIVRRTEDLSLVLFDLHLDSDDGLSNVRRMIEALDGEVRQRLDERRAAWEASGRTVIAWVHDLPHGDKMGLLAELTALTLDLREERTTLIRRAARAEAAELAELCDARITLHWTPDAEFLKPHSKPLLLTMLEEMGEEDVRPAALKKKDLIDWVADRAAERVWAPSVLSWTAPPEEAAPLDDQDRDGPRSDDAPDDDGRGTFVVTDAGQAALQPAA